jgi:hypothetical protein
MLRFLILYFLIFSVENVIAQAISKQDSVDSVTWGDNLYLEGGVGGKVEPNSSKISLSSSLLWEAKPAISFGIGAKGNIGVDTVQNNQISFGTNVFMRYAPFRFFPFCQIEYEGEVTSEKQKTLQGETSVMKWASKGLLGIGYGIQLKDGTRAVVQWMQAFYPNSSRVGEFRIGLMKKIGGNQSFDKNKTHGVLDLSSLEILEKIQLEGGLGASFGEQNVLNISPSVNFKLSPLLRLGLGVSVQYQYQDDSTKTQTTMGSRTYLRYQPKKQWLPFWQLEYEGLAAPRLSNQNIEERKKSWNHAILFGAGFTLPLAGTGGINIAFMRNLTWQGIEPSRPSPWVVKMSLLTNISNGEKNRTSFEDTVGWKRKLFFSGNVAAQMETNKVFDFSPTIGYWIKTWWAVGLGPSYQYEEGKESFGGNAFMMWLPNKKLPYLRVEYVTQKVQRSIHVEDTRTKWQHQGLLGAGYQFNILGQTSLGLSLLKELFENEKGKRSWVVRTSVNAPLFPTSSIHKKEEVVSALQSKMQEKLKEMFGGYTVEGNIGMSFGKNSMFDFSPLIGYKVSPSITIGGGPSFQYTRNSVQNLPSTTNYGGRAFTRWLPIKLKIPYLQVEYELLNSQTGTRDVLGKLERKWYSSVLGGGGIRFPIMEKYSFNVTVLYNMGWKSSTPLHASPWVVRTGFQF